MTKLAMKATLGTLVALLALAGCQKKEEPASTTTATPPATATATPVAAATATAPEVNLETLPTEEDFEEEADKEITSQNLEKKLDELEKEINAE